MKKALLFAAIAAMAMTSQAKSAMDSNLKMLWMNTDVTTNGTNARQGTAINGKFYIQNQATSKIEVWDMTGKVQEFNSGPGMNITRDDAGHIIVRTGAFPNAFSGTGNTGISIMDTDGITLSAFDIQGIGSGRADFFGHVAGDVMSDDGSYLYFGTQWMPLNEVPIINGKQDVFNTYQYTVTFNSAIKPDGTYTTTHTIGTYSFMKDQLVLLSPHYQKTNTAYNNGNSIQLLELDEDMNWTVTGYFSTFNHNGCSGFDVFEVEGNKYIVYSTGSNNCDGFSVSKLKILDSPANTDEDKNYRVSTKYAETKEDGNVMYSCNNCYANHLIVEPVPGEPSHVYIYQYVPQRYIAMYELDLSAYSPKPQSKPGDVNNDDVVDVSDINILLNIILGNDSAANYDGRADVTGDGSVDVSDVNAIINIMLGN